MLTAYYTLINSVKLGNKLNNMHIKYNEQWGA